MTLPKFWKLLTCTGCVESKRKIWENCWRNKYPKEIVKSNKMGGSVETHDYQCPKETAYGVI